MTQARAQEKPYSSVIDLLDAAREAAIAPRSE